MLQYSIKLVSIILGKLHQILWELVKLRNRSPVLRDSLYVTHSLAQLSIKGDSSLVRNY